MKTLAIISAAVLAELAVVAGTAIVLLAQESGVHFGPAEIVVVTALLAAVTGALVYVGRLLMASKDEQIRREQANTKDYQGIANDAVVAMKVALAAKFAAEGKSPPPGIAPVVPERHSEVTEEQRIAAEKATLRAAVTAAALALGLPPRTLQDAELTDEAAQALTDAVKGVAKEVIKDEVKAAIDQAIKDEAHEKP